MRSSSALRRGEGTRSEVSWAIADWRESRRSMEVLFHHVVVLSAAEKPGGRRTLRFDRNDAPRGRISMLLVEGSASRVVASIVLAGMLGWPVCPYPHLWPFPSHACRRSQLESLFGSKHS